MNRNNIKPVFGLALVLLLLMPLLTSGCPLRVGPQPGKSYPNRHWRYKPSNPPTTEDIAYLFDDLGRPDDDTRWNASRYLAQFIDEPGVYDRLLEALESDNAYEVRGAAVALGYLKPLRDDALPALIEALETGSAGAESEITNAISAYGIKAAAAVEPLIDVLDNATLAERSHAAFALGQLVPASMNAIPSLTAALHESGGGLAYAASRALGNFRDDAAPALPDLVETVGINWYPSSSTDECNLFLAIGEKSIPFLAEGIKTGNEQSRRHILASLLEFGDSAREPLEGLLNSDDPVVVMYAANGLKTLNGETPDKPYLIEIYADVVLHGSRDDANKALLSLQDIGSDAGAAIPALIEASYSKESAVSSGARKAIEYIGIRSTDDIDGLIKLLYHEERNVRLGGIEALKFLGPRAIKAVPDLTVLLDDKNSTTRTRALEALSEIQPSYETIPLLLEKLESDSVTTRSDAIRLLADYVDDSPSIVATIIQSLGDKQRTVREEAEETLFAMGTYVIPALIKALDDEKTEVRMNVMKTIAKFGPDAASAVDELTGMLEDENSDVRAEAMETLVVTNPDETDVVDALIRMLDDEDFQVRREAVNTLVEIGPAAKKSLPKLRDLAENDPYVSSANLIYYVRQAARDAIEKIEAMEEAASE